MSETETEVTELVESLVSYESENPPGNEAACAEFVADWLNERGVDADLVFEPFPDRPGVGARVGSGDGPSVVLNGHIDVVPAGDAEEWTTPAYEPAVRDGRLYGRGSADMKTGVAIAMDTMAALAPEFDSGALAGELVFHAAVGEETAEPGTKKLLEAGYTGDYGVCLEPTELRTATSEKGLVWYEITVKGDPSHASRPDEGDNAIANARPVLDALADYDAEIRERADDLVGRAYATVTKFQAGTKENVVPENAMITIDRRFLPEESADEIDEELDALLSEVEAEYDVETSWERTRTYESAAVPVECPVADAFRDASETVAGTSREAWGVKASTDVRNLVNDAGIQAVTWGPGTLDEAHTYDESIGVDEIEQGREALELAVRDLLD